jgi:hypothetical protein
MFYKITHICTKTTCCGIKYIRYSFITKIGFINQRFLIFVSGIKKHNSVNLEVDINH